MNLIDAVWLKTASLQALTFSLLEYRYLVRRFPQWLALCIGRSENERVRRLLLPNLIEELGGCGNAPSHLTLLDRTIESCGITDAREHAPTEETFKIEGWFFAVFSEQPIYNALCVLGPGTEAISSQFLEPLEEGLMRASPTRLLNLDYFAAHRTEMEEQHSLHIEQTIRFLEEIASEEKQVSLASERRRWISAGLEAHNSFWKHLKRKTLVCCI
ncbi:MAG: iron-containing redox enzyme family protein [Nitrososphaera sp.]|nr:iron-containing redox enzyme family protein [Nitrososphaera sp.]